MTEQQLQDAVKKYEGKWVGVLDKGVLGSDKDLRVLVTRLRKRLSERYSEAKVEYVTKQSVTLIL